MMMNNRGNPLRGVTLSDPASVQQAGPRQMPICVQALVPIS